MSACSKCGSELETKRGDLATGLCRYCREQMFTYCYGCRCYVIKNDRCFVCKPDPAWAESTAPSIRAEGTKVYKDECPCGIQASQCDYHAPPKAGGFTSEGDLS